jgi:hypothetical protein
MDPPRDITSSAPSTQLSSLPKLQDYKTREITVSTGMSGQEN